MKFPSSNWQEPKGFEPVPDTGTWQCCVCVSTHDLGYALSHGTVCKLHANMQPHAVRLATACRENGTRVSKDAFDAGRWNSYDRDALLPHFSDELLVEHTELTLKNCSRIRTPAATYDEAIQLYAAELAKRLDTRVKLDNILDQIEATEE